MATEGFKKPFRAEPVVLGEFARAKEARLRRKEGTRLVVKTLLLAVVVFAAGMFVTHW